MPFKKGQSGNEAGRKPGTPNKTTTELRLFISEFLNQNKSGLQRAWIELEPKDKFSAFQSLLKFALPQKMSQQIDFNNLDEDVLDAIIDRLNPNTNE
ncbi:hypothetical protein A8C56_23545 [Niabella ginsenosidivorans]|uniref:DUF5681 domain-containing protein n=1 Tax=Niabella ginsenosidivorans TaxID=1176587 RepID=A0A1A9I9Y9_9BACT|nr:hypothetical protein [Niabella ginsenosidivorans]ANH83550.1 hypothetical protein A8C56_23545 [Niabella ginsenosidivorans]